MPQTKAHTPRPPSSSSRRPRAHTVTSRVTGISPRSVRKPSKGARAVAPRLQGLDWASARPLAALTKIWTRHKQLLRPR